MPGLRQRLALDGDDADPAAEFLRRVYTTGKLAASDIARGARAFVAGSAGSSSDTVDRLAKAAPHKERNCKQGAQAGDTRNCSRGVRRALAKSSANRSLPPVVRIEIPLWSRERGACEHGPVAFLLPHLVLGRVESGAENGYCSIPADCPALEGDIERWATRSGISLDSGPPVAALSLWGDGAAYDLHDSLNLIILSILTGSHVRRYWVCGVGKRDLCRCGCGGRHSYESILSVLAWSLRAAAAGRHLSIDHMHKPLERNTYLGKLSSKSIRVRGALVAMQGDWDYYKKSGLVRPAWRRPNEEDIMATREPCPAFDFTDNADCRASRVTLELYMDEARQRENGFVTCLWGVPGFCLGICDMDWMHASCLGVVQYACGNVLWENFFPWEERFKNLAMHAA